MSTQSKNPVVYSEYLTTTQLGLIRDGLDRLAMACDNEIAEEHNNDGPDQVWIAQHEDKLRAVMALDRLLMDPDNGNGYVIVESTRP